MNSIFSFFIPRANVEYVESGDTLRQAIEKMEHHSYSAIPIIDEDDCFVGVLTEGDILWYLKKLGLTDLKATDRINVLSVPRHSQIKSVSAFEPLDNVIDLSLDQNFVPLSDDRGKFIGIVTRKKIITYLSEFYKKNKK